jgi:hypothetical protein
MSFGGDTPRRHDVILDDVAYKIVVEMADDRYFASWMCLACVELSGSTLRGDTPEEAIDRAKDRMADHHSRFHKGESC